MDEIITKIEIDAPPQSVWDVLTDFERFDEWNPTIDITGTLTEGDRIDIVLTLPDRKPQPFRPKLLTVDEPNELRWQGRLYVSGLYDGEHRFVGVLRDMEPLEIVLRLGSACLCGAILGWEREAHNKPAGLRTNMLVALATATARLSGWEL
jgi:hypothetical protein